jgi:hypothetical protein
VGTSLGTMSTSTLLIGGAVILVLLMSMGKR